MLMLRYPPAWTLNIDRLWTNYYYYYIYAHEGNVKGKKVEKKVSACHYEGPYY